MSAVRIVWHELRPLKPDLFRCDAPGCDRRATHIHLVPWCDASCKRALFACPTHDPGGYHFTVRSYLGEWIDWNQHLADKLDPRDPGPGGLGLLLRRLEQLAYPIVHVEEPAEDTPRAAQPSLPPAAPRRELVAGELTRYGQVALAGIVDTVRNAAEGTRNDTLNRAAFRCGQLAAAGQIALDVAAGELVAAALEAGLSQLEAKRTVASGLDAGGKHPAQIKDRR